MVGYLPAGTSMMRKEPATADRFLQRDTSLRRTSGGPCRRRSTGRHCCRGGDCPPITAPEALPVGPDEEAEGRTTDGPDPVQAQASVCVGGLRVSQKGLKT